jgi:hypothetical protein
LMHAMATAAKKGWPYAEEEIAGLIRDTAIQLGAVDPVKKQPYHEGSDVSTLVSQFLRRCGEKGVPLVLKGGRKLAIQRWMKSSWEILDGYGKQIAALDLGSSFVFEYVICMVSKSRVDLTNLSFDHPTVQSLEKNRSEKVARQTFMGSDRLPGRAARVMPVRDTMCTLYLFCGFGSNSLYLSVLLCTAVVGELLYEWRAAVWARR